MKFLVSLFLTALFAFALGLYLDWWSIAVAAFIVALIIPQQRPGASFLSGFLALLLLWGGYSIFLNWQNNGLLGSKIASVLPLHGNTMLLIVITAIAGGLVAGLAALSAGYLRRLPG